MSGWRAIMSDVNYGISNVGTVMTSCAGSQHLTPYHAKLERVKFGVPLEQVCRPDLPGPLLVSYSQPCPLSLVEVLHYCALIGRELHSVAGASNLMP